MTARLCRTLLALSFMAVPLAAQAPERELAREHPNRVRDSVSVLLRAALATDETSIEREVAGRLAEAYADVWDDGFFLRRARWILARPARDRRPYLTADSLRRVGREQFFRDGPRAAAVTFRAALRGFEALGDSVAAVMMLGNIGAAYYEAGVLDSATVYLERTRGAADRLGDRRTAANARTILGNVAYDRGDLARALALHLEAAELHAVIGDFAGVAADHNNAGLAAERAGDAQGAQRHFRLALDLNAEHAGSGAETRAGDYLVNLAAAAAERGDLREARTLFARADVLFHAAGESRNEALVARNLAALAAEVSDFETAIEEVRRAVRLSVAVRDPAGEVEARRLLASVYATLGRPDEALEEAGAAARLVAAQDPPNPQLAGAVAIVRGDVALSLNRLGEARAAYSEGARLAAIAGDRPAQAAAAEGRAHLDLRLGHHDQVVRDLEPLAAVLEPGRPRARVLVLLGMTRGELGDSGAARAALTDALAEYERVGDRQGGAIALAAMASLDVRVGRPQRALRLLADARARVSDLAESVWWLHLETGRAHQAAGDLPGATARYDSAVAAIEALGDRVRFDDRRAMFLEDKWDAYVALAEVWAQRGEPERAFAASERLRSRYLLDLLARRRPLPSREGTLRAEERRLSTRIAELTGRMMSADSGRRGPLSAGTAEQREELSAMQASYRVLLDRLREEEPAYVRALRGEPASPAEIRAALGPDELLLEYLVSDDELRIFATWDGGVRDFRVATSRRALAAQIDFVHWALRARPDQESLWRGALRDLDADLLEPVRRAGLLAGRTTVVVVPHLELHYLPFEALLHGAPGTERYFVQDHDVTYVPSASTWLRVRARPAPAASRVVALAPLDGELVGTRREIDGIGAVWGGEAVLYRGAAATRSALTAAGPARIVHLATRGVLNTANPLFSYVELRADDGRAVAHLNVHQVFDLSLPTDLLVLTACRTALGSGSVADVPTGDDWVGLVRAFLHAGANHVLATLWAVDDLATADLAAAFHANIANGASYARALADAKRAALAEPRRANPYLWAGLVLTGSP